MLDTDKGDLAIKVNGKVLMLNSQLVRQQAAAVGRIIERLHERGPRMQGEVASEGETDCLEGIESCLHAIMDAMDGQRVNEQEPEWTHFEQGVLHPDPDRHSEMCKVIGVDQVWMNSRYQVNVRYHWPLDANGREIYNEEQKVTALSIKRLDKEAVRDWREFQRIKNEILGPEVEGFELFPAESRLVDTANQYWIWCFSAGCSPFTQIGFKERLVMEGNTFGSKQRDFDDRRTREEAQETTRRVESGEYDDGRGSLKAWTDLRREQ
jgi:hypothetical protein